MKTLFATRWVHYLPALFAWLFAVGFLVLTYRLPPIARAMPVLVGWATLGLASLDLISRTGGAFGQGLMRALNPSGLKLQGDADTLEPRFGLKSGIGMVVLLVVGFLSIGILLAAPLVIFIALMLANRREPLLSAAIAAGATLVIWLLFAVLLRLQLYPGLIFGGAL